MSRSVLFKMISAVGVTALLAACGGGAKTGAAVNVDAGGQVHVETSEGTFDSGSSLPSDWPSDAPIYPDAVIQYSGSTNPTDGKAGAAVSFMTTDSVQDVVDFYKKAITDNGWTVTGTMQAAGSTVMGGTKDGRTMALSITNANGQTMVTIAIEKE